MEAFIIDPRDNVATLFTQNGKSGSTIRLQIDAQAADIRLLDDIPYAHKFAIRRIAKGEQVIKYGYSIGTATVDIQPGQHVHIHNTESNRGRGDLTSANKIATGVAQ